MKIVITIAIISLLILIWACCVIQKDGEYTEIYRRVYEEFQKYNYRTEEVRIQAEENMIKQYIKQGILPDKCINAYKFWRHVNYPI